MLTEVRIAVFLNTNQQITIRNGYLVVRISLQVNCQYKSDTAFEIDIRSGDKRMFK